MKKTILLIIGLTLIINSLVQPLVVFAAPNLKVPSITSQSVILIDADSGRVIYEKNADKKMYPASTTKILTCIIALEKAKLTDVVTVGAISSLIPRDAVHMTLTQGEQIPLEHLLYGLMLRSANDAAVVIAEHISGTVPDFAAEMNKKALELGAKSSHFVNPNGLFKKDHYTTARDMSLIAQYAMKNEKFRDIVSTIRYSIPATNKVALRDYIANGNQLIWQGGANKYANAIGIKTGYVPESGNCLVSAAKKNGVELIAVVFKANGKVMYTESIKLFEYAFNNFSKKNVMTKGQIVTTAIVEKTGQKFNLVAEKDVSLLLKAGEDQKIKTTVAVNSDLKLPIKSGEVYGTVTIQFDGQLIDKVNLLSNENIAKKILPTVKAPKFWWVYPIIAFIIWRIYKGFTKKKRRRRHRSTYYSNDSFSR